MKFAYKKTRERRVNTGSRQNNSAAEPATGRREITGWLESQKHFDSCCCVSTGLGILSSFTRRRCHATNENKNSKKYISFVASPLSLGLTHTGSRRRVIHRNWYHKSFVVVWKSLSRINCSHFDRAARETDWRLTAQLSLDSLNGFSNRHGRNIDIAAAWPKRRRTWKSFEGEKFQK